MIVRPTSACVEPLAPRLRSIDAGRQMDRARSTTRVEVEPLQRLGELRPDALQRLDLGEQRIEDFGAHGLSLARLVTAADRPIAPLRSAMPIDYSRDRMASQTPN